MEFQVETVASSIERNIPRVTTPLSELVSRLALLAGPQAYIMTARLLQDRDGIELKATYGEPESKREFVREVTFSVLDHLGAAAVAREFARDARKALSAVNGKVTRHRALNGAHRARK